MYYRELYVKEAHAAYDLRANVYDIDAANLPIREEAPPMVISIKNKRGGLRTFGSFCEAPQVMDTRDGRVVVYHQGHDHGTRLFLHGFPFAR